MNMIKWTLSYVDTGHWSLIGALFFFIFPVTSLHTGCLLLWFYFNLLYLARSSYTRNKILFRVGSAAMIGHNIMSLVYFTRHLWLQEDILYYETLFFLIGICLTTSSIQHFLRLDKEEEAYFALNK